MTGGGLSRSQTGAPDWAGRVSGISNSQISDFISVGRAPPDQFAVAELRSAGGASGFGRGGSGCGSACCWCRVLRTALLSIDGGEW